MEHLLQKSKCSIFHNIFKYMIFQRRQKVLLWSKGLRFEERGVLHQDNLHPLTCIKIYYSVVLPKALYGCENWFDLTESELLSLERAHRFCVKHMQSRSKRTRTDAALSLLGVFPIELELDSRKLTLFGQMCRLNSNSWVKNVFLNRLTSFTTHSNGRQIGFIADIFRLLGNINLDMF